MNGITRAFSGRRWVNQNSSAPSAIEPSDRNSAGSHPCQRARWYSLPPSSSGMPSAYPAIAASTSGAATPATIVRPLSTTGATRKPIGGSGHSVRSSGAPAAPFFVQKAPHTKRMPYAAVSAEPRRTPMSGMRAAVSVPPSRNEVSAASFATKPTVGATPAIEAIAMIEKVARVGACRPTPESSAMSRVLSWRSMTPTTRNSADLKRACPTSSARPASALLRSPYPRTTVSMPSWLTVPKARMRLRSDSRSAWKPPSSIVKTPSPMTMGRHGSVSAKAGAKRAMR